MRQQPALGVSDAGKRGRGSPADVQRAALGRHHASILVHAADRRGAGIQAWGSASCTASPIAESSGCRGVAAVHRADGIVMADTGDAVDHDHAGFGRVQWNRSTVCMIGGSAGCGKDRAEKPIPAIDTITSVGVTPYSIFGAMSSVA